MTWPETRVQLAATDRLLHTTPLDELSQPVLRDLEREYDARYGTFFGEPASVEVGRYPPEQFTAPDGTFLLVLRDGVAIAAGAFKKNSETTAEVKRMWTNSAYRNQGLAKIVLAELEAEASRRGFSEIVLSTGPRQPEAVRLYLGTGYEPLFDTSADAASIGIHFFRKALES